MKLSYRIAKRFLKSNIGQTILIVLGIAIGVSVQIFIGSLIQGLQSGLVEKTIGNSSQITITSREDDKMIYDFNDKIDIIKEKDDRVDKISVALDNSAFLQYNDQSQSLLVRGFNIEEADSIYNFIDTMVEGTYPRLENEIILGIDLKDEYGIALNDNIELLTFGRKQVEAKVVGFFDMNVASINKNWGITTLSTAQSIFDMEDTVTSIELQVNSNNVFEADEISDGIELALNDETLRYDNWKAQNGQLLSGLQGQSISSIMIQVFVIISVVLGIASVLAITVMQKSKQIGILKAMGIKNKQTSLIFLFEGFILGIFGAIVGIILGLLLAVAFTFFAVNPDGTPVVELYISGSFIAMSGAIAVVASMLAALVPAIRSSKLNPIDIIKNN